MPKNELWGALPSLLRTDIDCCSPRWFVGPFVVDVMLSVSDIHFREELCVGVVVPTTPVGTTIDAAAAIF